MIGANMKYFKVHHENGGSIVVQAENEKDAVEKFYESIKGMIGHQWKICKCYGDKPLDRSKVVRITKIEALTASEI